MARPITNNMESFETKKDILSNIYAVMKREGKSKDDYLFLKVGKRGINYLYNCYFIGDLKEDKHV